MKLILSVFLLTLVIYSCSPSSKFTNLYVDDAYKGMQFKKVLVVGMAKKNGEEKFMKMNSALN